MKHTIVIYNKYFEKIEEIPLEHFLIRPKFCNISKEAHCYRILTKVEKSVQYPDGVKVSGVGTCMDLE